MSLNPGEPMATHPKAAMTQHGPDWCHLCGRRRKYTADIWYPDNAEHDPPAAANGSADELHPLPPTPPVGGP